MLKTTAACGIKSSSQSSGCDLVHVHLTGHSSFLGCSMFLSECVFQVANDVGRKNKLAVPTQNDPMKPPPKRSHMLLVERVSRNWRYETRTDWKVILSGDPWILLTQVSISAFGNFVVLWSTGFVSSLLQPHTSSLCKFSRYSFSTVSLEIRGFLLQMAVEQKLGSD